ncbi:MAG: SUMF1/EgtB/PvdO family nonheme iron enzyme [Polyangiaceae bacterium]|nr:SUMF1/EgtB/PvdO family nonheme iron enzyme [Polyangiaceae bacterium]
MRQSLAFAGVLAVAATAGALLVMPGRKEVMLPAASVAESATAQTARELPQAAPPRPAPPSAPPSYVHIDPSSAQACGSGMVLVDGVHCPYVGHRCAAFDESVRDRCSTYAPEAICEGALQHLRFCVDVLEYPNIAGVRPAVWVGFNDAKRACAAEGKRLCAAEEWELACEGSSMWPYPYGLARRAEACNDLTVPPSERSKQLDDPWKRATLIAELDGRKPSGVMRECISPFGAKDMIGNVEEWVFHAAGNEDSKPFKTARKGGSFTSGKGRCRPIEASEPAWYRANDLGFRCCSDVAGSNGRAKTVNPNSGPLKKRVILPEPER